MSLVTCALLNTTTRYFVTLKNDEFGDSDDGVRVKGKRVRVNMRRDGKDLNEITQVKQ